MGEVYRARDTTLDRDVALKLLPEFFATDPDRLMRFEREAKTLASLNHPHIAQIYGVQQAGGTRALVMELVDGEDLAQRIARGAIPLDEALPVARQIADALAAAHDAGIIHRDLKPANVKVRPDATVKVLDFGLAKGTPAVGSTPGTDLAASPTFTSPALTQMGVILGTAAYMAPEQAKGKTVDRRADVWAFGCLLFEMLSGRRAFAGEDVTDTLAAIVRGEPEWKALPANCPPALARLLHRSLEKDVASRLDSMRVARLELDDAMISAGQPSPASSPPARTRRKAVVASALAIGSVALLGAAAAWRLTPAAPSSIRLAITPPTGTTLVLETNHHDLAILPDGQGLVYWTRSGTENQIVLRRFDQFDGVAFPNTATDARGMFVSPDGGWLGLQEGGEPGQFGSLVKMPTSGGASTRIAQLDGNLRGASWGRDDRILFATHAPATGLRRVRASGGPIEEVTTPDFAAGEVDHRWPALLPDATHAFFTLVRRTGPTAIGIADLEARTWRVLVENGTMPRYADGFLFFIADGVLRAVRFDERRADVVGDSVPLPYDVASKRSGAANYDIADDGTLVYRPGGTQSTDVGLAWTDRNGAITPLAVEPMSYRSLRVSPDGTKVATTVETEVGSTLWVVDLQRGTVTRLTPAGFSALAGEWRPDGRALVAPLIHMNEPFSLYRLEATGAVAPERLTTAGADERHVAPNWSADGRTILFVSGRAGRRRIMRLVEGSGPEEVLAGPANYTSPALSPDGRWLAYLSDESGRDEVHLRPYPDVSKDRMVVSRGGGRGPITWSPDGRQILYPTAGSQLMAVAVTPGATLSLGTPQFVQRFGTATFSFGLSPDTTRMLTTVYLESDHSLPNEFRVVTNLFEELRPLFR